MIIVFALAMFSCSSSEYTQTTGKIFACKNLECVEKADNIYLLNSGNLKDLEYQIIGVVEAEGILEEMTLSRVKYIAWENCANAILDLKTEKSNNFEEVDNFIPKKISGLAVKVNEDSIFYAKFGKLKDLKFIRDIKSSKVQ